MIGLPADDNHYYPLFEKCVELDLPLSTCQLDHQSRKRCRAYTFGREARLTMGFLVGSSYLFRDLINLWATRGRHVGWVLYAVAVLLILYGLGKPGG